MADEAARDARPARDRRAPMRPGEVARPSGAPRSTRPTAAESATAQALLEALRSLGLLRGKAPRISPNVIALALAMRQNDTTLHGLEDDECNELFGVTAGSDVRRQWVDDATKRLDIAEAYKHLGTSNDHERDAFTLRVRSGEELSARRERDGAHHHRCSVWDGCWALWAF